MMDTFKIHGPSTLKIQLMLDILKIHGPLKFKLTSWAVAKHNKSVVKKS